MAMLHTVNKSPFEINSLERCLQMAKSGSSVLLIEDGVYGALDGTVFSAKVKAADGLTTYVLGPDLKTRGLDPAKLIEGIEIIDYDGFVQLVADHDRIQSWL
ncbi:MAG: sulfurtransferase complex subunit TusB [Arenicellales bacterium]|jgi:tRNA 2-thiouridine synthesizing protein B|nr:sulfurtransferase complex subunit TusB [Acidiferrobacteraceae bacterium]MDP6289933.1 sulfurtransferase complex subunit TusB [Arenicellales bacterium]MDP7282844.1 sulfurtransferase complex subunit TusB [Arenicellales bacterium]MDP7481858.1 sulfurtransferase complex subunit TusB [Arenicellales bacterium]MDP7521415.1 sulfurtransferase complex subunit TusB [Arenicellales bacterium]|tara:strand:+ start:170 stop:475 length:306 start_codon:yes stop_codon:yes gene_type:complete